MAKSFTITTTATDTLRADAKGHAEALFTVTNTTPRPIRGIVKAKALGDTKQEWLSIAGETERDFAAGATQQFTVSFDAADAAQPTPGARPTGATPSGGGAGGGVPARKYPFRLDVSSARNPDEDFTEGPTVNVEVAAAAAPVKKPFPLWIIFVILGIVILIGGVVFVVVRSRQKVIITPPSRQKVLLNFADQAPSARWTNNAGQTLPYNGSEGDDRGFVINRDGAPLENGSTAVKVIETHPKWENSGKITGSYILPEPIREGDKFRVTVGFLSGAGAGNIRLRVLLNGNVIDEIPKSYDGALRDWTVDLNNYAGQSGTFSLEVAAIPTSAQAWICWINPRIEQ